MVLAFLRGLLPSCHKNGLRSRAFEDLRLEGILAQLQAESLSLNAVIDTNILSCLEHGAKQETLSRVRRQVARKAELLLMDIYDFEGGQPKSSTQISLLKLFQLAKKTGIFDAIHNFTSAPESQ